MKPIVFLTSGTRGDVQPVSYLARAMQDKGHSVRVAAPLNFQEIVEAQSVPFVPLKGNPSDLLTAPGAQSALTFNNSPLQGIKSALEYLKAAKPVYAEMIQNAWLASQDASALVIGLPTIWGSSLAEKLGIPCIGAFLQPVTSTNEFPSPLLPTTLKLGRGYNKLTYWLISQSVHLPWMGVINKWRKESLGLNSLPFFCSYFEKMNAILYGFSERVLPRPNDWGERNFITGYWSAPDSSYSPSDELKSFLAVNEKPFFFGFGSPGMHDPQALFELLITAIEKTGIRAVISLPKDINAVIQSKNIFLQKETIPHRWLFPQMAGIIHHGGAGTTAEALKSGVPSFVTPLAVDQFFWGERVYQLGVGPRAVPQRELTGKNLVNALNEMKGKVMKENAKKLGKELRTENGIAEAARILETLLKTIAG
ncbi:MAG: glycosyltransferase family 1 protein [Anaerolineales bacterium]|nr:glycosyltransferase family 1 protein [Anaerolineales bacterium]